MEKVIGVVFQLRPYRCRACMRRYWGLAWNPRSLHRHRNTIAAVGVVLVAVLGGYLYLKTLPYEAELPREPGVRPAAPPVVVQATENGGQGAADDVTSNSSPGVPGITTGDGSGGVGRQGGEPKQDFQSQDPQSQDAQAQDLSEGAELTPRLPSAPPFEAAALRDRGRLLDVVTASDDAELHLLLQTDAPPRSFQHFRMLAPERLVIDIQGRWSTDLPGALSLGHPLAERLRVGTHEDMVRVVVELVDGNIRTSDVEVRADGLALILKRP